MTDAEIEQYLRHKNGGDVHSALAYRQLKVLEKIRDLLDEALLADREEYDDAPADLGPPRDRFQGPTGG